MRTILITFKRVLAKLGVNWKQFFRPHRISSAFSYRNSAPREPRTMALDKQLPNESCPALKIEENKEEPNHRKTQPHQPMFFHMTTLLHLNLSLKNSKKHMVLERLRDSLLHICVFFPNIHPYLHFESSGFKNTTKPWGLTEGHFKEHSTS